MGCMYTIIYVAILGDFEISKKILSNQLTNGLTDLEELLLIKMTLTCRICIYGTCIIPPLQHFFHFALLNFIKILGKGKTYQLTLLSYKQKHQEQIQALQGVPHSRIQAVLD